MEEIIEKDEVDRQELEEDEEEEVGWREEDEQQ